MNNQDCFIKNINSKEQDRISVKLWIIFQRVRITDAAFIMKLPCTSVK
jgi:hypothetical protein